MLLLLILGGCATQSDSPDSEKDTSRNHPLVVKVAALKLGDNASLVRNVYPNVKFPDLNDPAHVNGKYGDPEKTDLISVTLSQGHVTSV